MNKLNGLIFKLVNRPVYDTLVLGLDLNALAKAHEAAGFEVLKCEHFICVDFGIPKGVGLNLQHISTRIKGFFMQNLTRLDKAFWAIEERSVAFKSTQLLSPFIMLTGKKK